MLRLTDHEIHDTASDIRFGNRVGKRHPLKPNQLRGALCHKSRLTEEPRLAFNLSLVFPKESVECFQLDSSNCKKSVYCFQLVSSIFKGFVQSNASMVSFQL